MKTAYFIADKESPFVQKLASELEGKSGILVSYLDSTTTEVASLHRIVVCFSEEKPSADIWRLIDAVWKGGRTLLLPVVLPGGEKPAFFADVGDADFRADWNHAFERLLRGLH